MNIPQLGTKYEDTDKILTIARQERIIADEYDTFFKEVIQNYKRVAGYIFNKSDLDYLQREKRPHFQYNHFLPIIMQMLGNFKGNISRVEAVGRTMDDYQKSDLITKVLQYELYTVNNLDRELAVAYMDALIGRVGWLVLDWYYGDNPQGDLRIKRYYPFRIKIDTGTTDLMRLSDCNFIIDSAWYGLEELQKTFAYNNPELWEEFEEKGKYYLRENSRGGVVSVIERVWGSLNKYLGNTQGYDEQDELSNLSSSEWYNSERGLFKVLEYHERRNEMHYFLYDPTTNMNYNITKAIGAQENGYKYDNAKMQMVRRAYPNSVIRRQVVSQIYQVNVIPALNMKVVDSPTDVQNGHFKFIPIWAYNLGAIPLDNKSVIDHIKDPVSSYNKRRNSMLEYIIRLSSGEIWAEESALGDHEDEFKQHEIGGIKKVADGALTGGKIQRVDPAPFPTGMHQYMQEDAEDVRYISGVRENSQGGAEMSGESGRLFSLRVRQANIMQEWIFDNAMQQQKFLAEIALNYIQKYMQEERVIRITQDQNADPEYVIINQRLANQILNDVTIGEYDIQISRTPYGADSRTQAFNELLLINEQLMALNPAFVDPVVLVKASSNPYKQDLIRRIMQAQKQQAIQAEQERMLQAQQAKPQIESQELDNMKKAAEIAQSMETENAPERMALNGTVKQLGRAANA